VNWKALKLDRITKIIEESRKKIQMELLQSINNDGIYERVAEGEWKPGL